MIIQKIFNGKIELFMLKRVLILLLILTAVNVIFFKEKRIIFIGLVIGALCGLLRFSFMAKTYNQILGIGNSSRATIVSLTLFITSLLGTVAILVTSIITNLWLFGGVTTGILFVPFILTINSLTEGLGITHNNFE